jgi:hypothetical protein
MPTYVHVNNVEGKLAIEHYSIRLFPVVENSKREKKKKTSFFLEKFLALLGVPVPRATECLRDV